MSGSFIIVGLFGLTNGHHVRTPKPNDPTVSVFHAVYTTAIHFPSGPSLQAQIHIWSPSNDVLHMNDTVALVFAKAFVPPNPDPSTIVLLEAYYIYSFPGDPASDTYEDGIPNMPYPFIFGLGTVSGTQASFNDDHVGFPLTLTDYVRDGNKQTTIQYVFLHFRCTYLILLIDAL